MSTFTDNFTAADGTNLIGYNGWTRRSGDANTAAITSHQVNFGSGGIALFLSPAAPVTTSVNITATLIVPSGGTAGMIVGVVGQADSAGLNYYALLHNGFSNVVQIYAFVAGSPTLVASTSMTLAAGTYTFELGLHPGSQLAKVNGSTACSATDTTVPSNSHTGLTCNNSLSSGADVVSSFTTADAPNIIPPNDASLINAYSPLQWRVTSTAAVATTLGSEMNFSFTGTSCSVGLDLSQWSSAGSGYPVLSYSIDDAAQTEVQLTSGQTSLSLATGLSSGTHTAKLTYLIANNTSMSRWTDDGAGGGPACSLRVTNLTIDGGCTAASSILYPNLLLILGDSLSECDYSAPGSILNGDPRTNFSYQLGESMGYVTSRITYAGTGYSAVATDNVPVVGTHWKNFDSVHARPISSVAATIQIVVILHGVNDIGTSGATVQAAAQALYADLLAQLPNATILVYVPFGQAIASTLAAAVNTTGNGRVKLRNLGSNYSIGLTNSGSATYQSPDGIHPNTMTHALLRGAMIADIQTSLGSTPANSRTVGGGLLAGL